jgi:hypothetical protein
MKSRKHLAILLVALVIVGVTFLILLRFSNTPPEPKIKSDNFERAAASLSVERMITFLEKLTAINPHSGWRGSATIGEALAFDLVEKEVNKLEWLKSQGMTLERESFHVFLGTQDYMSKVVLTVGDRSVEIPADTTRGNRDNPAAAIRLDSDSSMIDTESNPIQMTGGVVLVSDLTTLEKLSGSSLTGKILLVNYQLVDTGLQSSAQAMPPAQKMLDLKPAAVILVTEPSNTVGGSHGTFIGDGGGGFQNVIGYDAIPLLFIGMENLAPLGITTWVQMKTITRADVVWDVDVTNPATSGNLIVHIPGQRGGKPVLITAHLDSAHSPGALDDGSGSAILIEIATILNEQHLSPTDDLYLVWYGSEELGLYGSTYFTTTHSDLINDLQANIQIDCLSHPLDGLPAKINLSFSHFVGSSVETDPLAKYLVDRGSAMDEEVELSYWPFSSDNGSLTAFDIPNLNMIYESEKMAKTYAGVWYSGHMHDPYDTVELVREMKDVFAAMGKLSLSGAFIPSDQQNFVNRSAGRKVVFLANHTESPHMTPTGFPEFSLALMNAGYEITVVPYGETLSPADLEGADLVVVLPVYDYPVGEDTKNSYDTSWTQEEAKVLDAYAQNGGIVLVVNSGTRLKLYNRMYDINEDWADLNTLTDQWGIHFNKVGANSSTVSVQFNGTTFQMILTPSNTVVFSAPSGSVLAGSAGEAAFAEVTIGSGRVIVLGDLSALGEYDTGLINKELVKSIANLK